MGNLAPAQVKHRTRTDTHHQPCSLTIVMWSCASQEKAFRCTCCTVRQGEGDCDQAVFPALGDFLHQTAYLALSYCYCWGRKSTASFKDNLRAILSFAPTQAGRKKNFIFSDSYFTV